MNTRRIPEVTIAALVLGGCGGGGDDADTSLARRACRAFQSCDPDEFALEYGSIRECASQLNRYLDQIDALPSACANAYRLYLECFYSVYDAPACDDDAAYEACSSEYEAVYAACEGLLD